MTEQLTFIHAADLHLGAPFRGLRALSEQWASRLLTAISEAYDRVVDAALARRVDFVVMAGDIFDLAHPSYGDYLHFFEGLRRLEEADIPVYLVTGNHDPYVSWTHSFASLPPNAVMLPADRPGFSLYRRDGRALCLIGGRGYYNQTWPADECIADGVTRDAALRALLPDEPDAEQAPFAVGLLHTGLHLDTVKAPSDPKLLARAGMDYWALGHVHTKYVYPSQSDPRMVFSGSIQGRDINEQGEHGVFVVTLTADGFSEPGRARTRVEFVPTASVVWQRVSVDVGDCTTLSEVCDRVMAELFRVNGRAHCDRMVTRVTLSGATPLHAVLRRPGVVDDLRKQINDAYSEFFCDALVDRTCAPRDLDALRQEALFPSVLLGISASQRADAEGQAAYLQEAFLKKNLSLPSACVRAVDELGAEAENLVLDLLLQGDA